jgi:hypothetical protein
LSFVLEQLQKNAFRELFEVFPFCNDVEELHRVIYAHPLQFQGLVHVAKVQQLNDVFQID